MAASLKDPGSITGGGPKRFHDSFNFVFYIVGECISCAADTHLATDLTCKKKIQTGLIGKMPLRNFHGAWEGDSRSVWRVLKEIVAWPTDDQDDSWIWKGHSLMTIWSIGLLRRYLNTLFMWQPKCISNLKGLKHLMTPCPGGLLDTLPLMFSNVAPGGGKNEPHERVLGGEVKKN